MAETSTTSSTPPDPASPTPFPLPRVTIRFCTQCKWMLRAAYFAQELLSTFSTSLGEVALQPSTGGTFVVTISHHPPTPPTTSSTSSTSATIQHRVLWDRRTDGGFPETKELKRRVRDAIDPGRDLGHVDKDYSASKAAKAKAEEPAPAPATEKAAVETQTRGSADPPGPPVVGECEDCK
ncbi:Rdx family-domain-containing protein [Whalleya microplaca]|nr:Rdx family-domain-containing protein [Whalleya microplaca]